MKKQMKLTKTNEITESCSKKKNYFYNDVDCF